MSVGRNDVRLERARAVPRLWHGVGALVLSLALAGCGGDEGSTATESPQQAIAPAAEASPSSAPLAITDTAPASYQWDVLGIGKSVHIDGAQSFTAVPGKYKGLKFLQTANADRFLSASNAIAFHTNRDVAVLVAYDVQAAVSKPIWLNDWTDTGDTLTTSDTSYRVYRKAFGGGTVALGGNELGVNSYSVVVDDGSALGNAAPTISGFAQSEINATNEYSFVPTAGDADGDSLTFAATNLPKWAAVDAATGAVTGTPAADDIGSHSDIIITVNDGSTSTSLAPFTIRVNAAESNSAPVIAGQPQTVIAKDNLYSFIPTATDPDGDTLTFSVTNLPRWANFYSDSGRIRGTPGTGDIGTYADIVVSVSDGSSSSSLAAFSVQVRADSANSAPTIGGTPPTSVSAGRAYSFTPVAADPDRDSLAFSIRNRPSWAAFNSSTGRLSGTPQSSNAGTYANITISVSDGRATTALTTFTISVAGASQTAAPPASTPPTNPPTTNSPPQISGNPPITVVSGQAYMFTPSANDADGHSLTFTITNRPSWVTFNNGTGRLSGTPSAAHVGTHGGIVITVSDGQATRSLPTFAITVTATSPSPSAPPANSPPSISGTPTTSVRQDQTYSFSPSASDSNSDDLTFSIVNRPSWAGFSSTTGRLSGTPRAADVGRYSGIVISVSDGEASRSLQSFDIAVTAATTGSATLSWNPPTRNSDGSSLTNLSGYRVYWGRSPRSYSDSVTLNNPGIATYVVEQLTSGTWYFATTALNSQGVESGLSNEGSKTIP